MPSTSLNREKTSFSLELFYATIFLVDKVCPTKRGNLNHNKQIFNFDEIYNSKVTAPIEGELEG
jgi:hypothetical protein